MLLVNRVVCRVICVPFLQDVDGIKARARAWVILQGASTFLRILLQSVLRLRVIQLQRCKLTGLVLGSYTYVASSV